LKLIDVPTDGCIWETRLPIYSQIENFFISFIKENFLYLLIYFFIVVPEDWIEICDSCSFDNNSDLCAEIICAIGSTISD